MSSTKIFDFGKNTYQLTIAFKFHCLSADAIRGMVHKLYVEDKHFTELSKEQDGGHAVLAKGEGNPKSPFFQLKIGTDALVLWAGWHVHYQQWQEWRRWGLNEVSPLIGGLSPQLVAYFYSQSTILVPSEKVKPGDEIPELQPLRAFYRRFLPEELMKKGNAFVIFSDQDSRQNVEWAVGGSTVPGEENIVFNVRLNKPGPNATIEENLSAHTAQADWLLQQFHCGFLSLVLKT